MSHKVWASTWDVCSPIASMIGLSGTRANTNAHTVYRVVARCLCTLIMDVNVMGLLMIYLNRSFSKVEWLYYKHHEWYLKNKNWVWGVTVNSVMRSRELHDVPRCSQKPMRTASAAENKFPVSDGFCDCTLGHTLNEKVCPNIHTLLKYLVKCSLASQQYHKLIILAGYVTSLLAKIA